jgi:uncharacterized protein YjlB
MEIISKIIIPHGNFPNNPHLPVLLYKKVLNAMTAEELLQHFEKNHWNHGWINGIYDFHHYHGNTHEVLGICGGSATVQVGGEGGSIFELETQDVLLLPAGTAHKKLKSTEDFVCVGAYPFDIPYDMHYGKENERMAAEERIQRVPLPSTDPVYGDTGPMFDYWKI